MSRYAFWKSPPWYATRETKLMNPLLVSKELEWQLSLDCTEEDFKCDKEAKLAKKKVAQISRLASKYLKSLGKNGVLLYTEE